MELDVWKKQMIERTPLATEITHRNVPGYMIAEDRSFNMYTYYPASFVKAFSSEYPHIAIIQLSYVVTIADRMIVEEFKIMCKNNDDLNTSTLASNSLDKRMSFSYLSNSPKDDLVYFRFIADEMRTFICEEGYNRLNHLYEDHAYVLPDNLESIKPEK